MGGSKEERVSGLRWHLSNGEAHMHDDAKGLKFKMESTAFKKEAEDALDMLKKSDGIVEIPGDGKDSLCIMRSGRTISVFVKDSVSIKQKFQSFLRNC
jgi:hypothetical protein